MSGRCSIYADRPEICRVYPRPGDWRPIACTYRFDRDGARRGECDSSVCGVHACCNFPRGSGETAGDPTAIFDRHKGAPCRELRGLEGQAPPDRHYAQTTIHELWIGALYIRRVAAVGHGSTFHVSQLGMDGQIALTLVIPGATLARLLLNAQDAIQRGAGVTFTFALPDGPLCLQLASDEVAALLELHPDPVEAGPGMPQSG